VDFGTDRRFAIGTTGFVTFGLADPLAIGAGVPLAFGPSLVVGTGSFTFDEDLAER
jgi:hypothetical protein